MTAVHSLDGEVVDALPAELALYPYGVFTTFVVEDDGVVGLDAHLERLRRDAAALWGHDLDARLVLAAAAAHLVRASSVPQVMRVTLVPEAVALARPADAAGCRVLVSMRPLAAAASLRVGTAQHVRALPSIKSTDLLVQLHLRRLAQLAGHDDVLLCRGEEVLEGATWSVVAWTRDAMISPVDDVLPSVTVDLIARLADSLGRRVERRPVTVDEIFEAELVLAVSATAPARPLVAIDGRELPVDRDLQGAVAREYAALPRDALRARP
ncbi:aminotransferase class IV [Nocardioides sp. TRM66260-LWL]|uniref:aminotransferase class IV n=1 Tax=Nocardioides sp. TRM66260-LWL TaxID=2874478 RepID=UPI001CC59614|nr:aminotransferase class IV [Nocardioides sp. TRM66260-LWL]MBZ5734140.1 aminotransferase class IV [Nocardioides sp. TRM66260-LWL]